MKAVVSRGGGYRTILGGEEKLAEVKISSCWLKVLQEEWSSFSLGHFCGVVNNVYNSNRTGVFNFGTSVCFDVNGDQVKEE